MSGVEIVFEMKDNEYLGKYTGEERLVTMNLLNLWKDSGSDRTFINLFAETLAHEFFHDAIRCEGDDLFGALVDRAFDMGSRRRLDGDGIGDLMVDMEEEVVKKCGLAKRHMTREKELELFYEILFERIDSAPWEKEFWKDEHYKL